MSGVTMKELGLLALEIWESLGEDRLATKLSPAQRAEFCPT
jgi:hypothetical protein